MDMIRKWIGLVVLAMVLMFVAEPIGCTYGYHKSFGAEPVKESVVDTTTKRIAEAGKDAAEDTKEAAKKVTEVIKDAKEDMAKVADGVEDLEVLAADAEKGLESMAKGDSFFAPWAESAIYILGAFGAICAFVISICRLGKKKKDVPPVS